MRNITVVGLTALLALGVGTGISGAAPEEVEPPVAAMAEGLGISQDAARVRLRQQERAHEVLAALPSSVETAGRWYDAGREALTVAVTSSEAAATARAHGAEAVLVARSAGTLAQLRDRVNALLTPDVEFNTIGVDQRANEVLVTVNRTRMNKATRRFVAAASAIEGVRVHQSDSSPRQQSGEVRPGNPWWPQGESNCSVGFPAQDSSGNKHFLTAGHCTNNANQAAYGQSGNVNRIGTSNVGGTRSVNGGEGDMGVVAVTESGWTVSPSVNTWGSAAATVTGSAEALVGESVCHSGNTSKWRCGTVTYVNETVDYGGTIVNGLTFTTACSLGGDSGGAWLRGDKAVGLHSGGPSQCVQNPGKDDQSIFQPVNEALRKWNLTLVTGGGGGDTQAPSAPANLRSPAQTADSLSLAWNASTDNVGVTGYDVYLGATLATTVGTTSATVTGLTPDTAYSVTVRAKDAAGNASAPSAALTVRTQPGTGGGRTFTNGTDYAIADFRTAASPIRSTATGSAAARVQVSVTARHSCQEDLQLRVVSPAGWRYTLKNSGGSTCTQFPGTASYSFSPFTESATGTWTLEVADNGAGDTGTLDSWSITL